MNSPGETGVVSLLEQYAAGTLSLEQLRDAFAEVSAATPAEINALFDYLDEKAEDSSISSDDVEAIETMIAALGFDDDADLDDSNPDVTQFQKFNSAAEAAPAESAGAFKPEDFDEEATAVNPDLAEDWEDDDEPTQITIPPEPDNLTTGSGFSTTGSWRNIRTGSGKTPSVGDVLKDRFVLEKKIGSGGMGLVFKARDLRKEEAQDRNPYLAIKILNDDFKEHPDALIALQREARKSQALAHVNVVNVFDFDRDGDDVYMTMELLDGFPLDRVIKRSNTNPLTTDVAISYIKQMARGLQYAHNQGIVHSDFKPSNVFLTADGTVRILDFGIARAGTLHTGAVGEETLFDANTLGAMTPAYASPEMLEGQQPDEAGDMYALGCVAYELFCGKHPFDKKPATEARDAGMVPPSIPGLSGGPWRAILGALAFDPEKRIPNAMAFILQLEETWFKRYRVAVAAGALVTVGALSAALYIPGYLEQKELAALRLSLRSFDPLQIEPALARTQALEEDIQRGVLGDVSNQLLAYFQMRSEDIFDPAADRFDYPGAVEQWQQAAALFAFNDAASGLIETRLSALNDSRNRLLSQFDSAFNAALRRFEGDDTGAAQTLIGILEQADQVYPNGPMTQDMRLPLAAVDVSNNAAKLGDFEIARDVVRTFQPWFPDAAMLKDQLDLIDEEERKVSTAVQVFLQEAEVTKARSDLSSLDDLGLLGEAMTSLEQLDAANAELVAGKRAAGRFLWSHVDEAIATHNWSEAEAAIDQYALLLPIAVLDALRARLDQSQGEWRADIRLKLDRLHASPAPGEEADLRAKVGLLGEIRDLNPDEITTLHAERTVVRGVLSRVNAQRSQGQFDNAGDTLLLVLQIDPPVAGSDHLKALQQQIDSEATGAVDAPAPSVVEEVILAINNVLAQEVVDAQSAAALQAGIDRLSLLAPEDSRGWDAWQTIESRFINTVEASEATEGLEPAQARNEALLRLLPASQALMDLNLSLEYRIAEMASQAREQKRIEALAALDQKLNDATLDTAWYDDVKGRLNTLESDLRLDAETAVALRQRISLLYADGATAAREAGRFTEARQRVSTGRTFDRDSERWGQELDLLEQAAEQARKAAEDAARLARVDAVKQTFITQARALEVDAAKTTLATLETLSPGDAFLQQTAPSELIASYARLGEEAFEAGDYSDVANITQAGLEEYPGSERLLVLFERAMIQDRKAVVIASLSGRERPRSDIDELIEAIRTMDADNFQAHLQDIRLGIADNLAELSKNNPLRAREYADDAEVLLEKFGDQN